MKVGVLKALVFVACSAPLALLVAEGLRGELGANPVETITHATGEWTLRLLLVTLAVTPARRLTGWHVLARVRRMLGLFAFFYVSLHFLTYAILDASLDVAYIAEDVLKRPYITVGFVSLVVLVPLAVTSTDAMVRRLGGRLWRRLHRLAYVAALGGVLHFLWLVKADTREPLVYAAVFAVLMLARISAVADALPRLRSGLARRRGHPVGLSDGEDPQADDGRGRPVPQGGR